MIQLDNLSREFEGEPALQQLNLEVEEGEIFAVSGPDGSGKTTLCRLLAGVLSPSSGQGEILGHDLATEPDLLKSQIGYIPDQFGLYPDLTVDENLQFYADVYGVPTGERSSRIEDLLDLTRLTPFRDRAGGNLSGGMKKKLSLSCALLSRPRLLIMDEPTRGIDPVSRRELWELFYSYYREGVTILLSTISLSEAERCNRVGFLYGGRFLDVGTPESLREQFAETVLQLRVPRPRAVLESLRQELPGATVNLFGEDLHVATRREKETHGAIREILNRHDQTPIKLETIPPTLDDVFLDRLPDGESSL